MGNKKMIAHYKFNDESAIAKDYSGNGMDGTVLGTNPPTIKDIDGRKAISFSGGAHGTSYVKLPENLLSESLTHMGEEITTPCFGAFT